MIEIRRYGHYINSVKSAKELKQWVLDNVPYENETGSSRLISAMTNVWQIAEAKGFSFKYPKAEIAKSVLERVKIEELAEQFVLLTKRGANYTFRCPFCNDEEPRAMISPKYQIFRCYKCGRSGNAIHFLMEIKKCSYEDALEWLDRKYPKK